MLPLLRLIPLSLGSTFLSIISLWFKVNFCLMRIDNSIFFWFPFVWYTFYPLTFPMFVFLDLSWSLIDSIYTCLVFVSTLPGFVSWLAHLIYLHLLVIINMAIISFDIFLNYFLGLFCRPFIFPLFFVLLWFDDHL